MEPHKKKKKKKKEEEEEEKRRRRTPSTRGRALEPDKKGRPDIS